MAPTHPEAETNHALPAGIQKPLLFGFWSILIVLLSFVLWAGSAPLATSIPANGHLNAQKPSYDIQHPFGGKIANVYVATHTTVRKGQLLLSLDVSNMEAEHKELQAALAPMQEERATLQSALLNTLSEESQNDLGPQARLALDRMKNMKDALLLREEMNAKLEAKLFERAGSVRDSMSFLEARRQSMVARLTRYTTLANQGALRVAEIDALKESILEVEASLSREQAELASLESQATQAKMQIAQEKLQFRQQVLDRLAQLEEAIPRLRLQALRLSAEIDMADIRAPDAGTVTELKYDTAAMVVNRGDTVLTLARATDALDVAFVATPQSIDQLYVGMQGSLTVTSLPQRKHPKVRVTISALSPEARRDREGRILGYDGIAAMNTQDRRALQAELGDHLSLSTDMPVHLVFTGRQMTFSDYLIEPFWVFLRQAMQD